MIAQCDVEVIGTSINTFVCNDALSNIFVYNVIIPYAIREDVGFQYLKNSRFSTVFEIIYFCLSGHFNSMLKCN